MAIFEGLLGNIFLGIIAIAILLYSAEFVVRKLIKLAHHFGVSDTFMGMSVMALGTSMPEIGSHLAASIGILSGNLNYKIASSAVLGANIGSDVVQQTFVLGLVIFLMGSLTFSKEFLKKDYSMMVATTLITMLLGLDHKISRLDGAIMIGIFIWYMTFLYEQEDEHIPEKEVLDHPLWIEITLTIFGMAILLGSSSIVLEVVEYVVKTTGLGGSIIGVFSVGLSSALPEMFTAIEGIKKSATGISLGTLIGSNITNPMLAIGMGGLISEYYVPKPLIYWDLPMETVTAGLLLIYLLFHDNELGRGGAIYLMLLYFGYAIVRIIYFPHDAW